MAVALSLSYLGLLHGVFYRLHDSCRHARLCSRRGVADTLPGGVCALKCRSAGMCSAYQARLQGCEVCCTWQSGGCVLGGPRHGC